MGAGVHISQYNQLGYQEFVVKGTDGQVQFKYLGGISNYISYKIEELDSLHDMSIWFSRSLCVDLRPEKWNWYGGPSRIHQYWPIQKSMYKRHAYVPTQKDHASTAERYWLNSAGGFVFINDLVPLFVSQNDNDSKLCFYSANEKPYNPGDLNMPVVIGVGENAREAHLRAVTEYLKRSRRVPDDRMVRYPIWSTAGRYKTHVNEAAVLRFADEIQQHGFKHAQIEIDDKWETCYGSLEFDAGKFPNMRNMTDLLKRKQFRTTLWVHPFVNKECDDIYRIGSSNG